MAFKIPEFDFKGIKRIEIPKLDSDFSGDDYGFSIIKKYLPSILATHNINSQKINFLYNYFLGEQDILNKTRLYQKDSENNNIVVENHAFKQVSFKTAYTTGEKRDYTHKSDSTSDDLIYLDRYYTDCGFFPKDKELKDWIYSTGIGITRTVPRTDIIVRKNGITRYANAKEGFDINYNAPFKFNTLDPRTNFVVYSSSFDKEPLFCVSIVEIDVSGEDDKMPSFAKEIHIETRYASMVIQSDLGYTSYLWDKGATTILPKALRYLPLIEHSSNSQRMSLIENNRSLFNLINTLKSNVIDMIVDNANAIFVFKNTDIDAEQVIAMRKAGAVIISDSNNAHQGSQADLDVIRVEIPFDGLNDFSDRIMENCYDIAGVPLGSGQVTSGGDTGQARLLNGGWTSAWEMAQNDIMTFLVSDYEVLKTILLICRQIPNCPLNSLHASQIDIKYRINQTDNFLVKSQGIINLYSANMPLEEILKASGLFSDITTVAQKWQNRIDKMNQKPTETIEIKEETNLPRPDNRVVSANNDNNSQE